MSETTEQEKPAEEKPTVIVNVGVPPVVPTEGVGKVPSREAIGEALEKVDIPAE